LFDLVPLIAQAVRDRSGPVGLTGGDGGEQLAEELVGDLFGVGRLTPRRGAG
jgi:hypothetical protein